MPQKETELKQTCIVVVLPMDEQQGFLDLVGLQVGRHVDVSLRGLPQGPFLSLEAEGCQCPAITPSSLANSHSDDMLLTQLIRIWGQQLQEGRCQWGCLACYPVLQWHPPCYWLHAAFMPLRVEAVLQHHCCGLPCRPRQSQSSWRSNPKVRMISSSSKALMSILLDNEQAFKVQKMTD